MKLGSLEANTAFALAREEDGSGLTAYLDDLGAEEIEALVDAAQFLDKWGQEVIEWRAASLAQRIGAYEQP